MKLGFEIELYKNQSVFTNMQIANDNNKLRLLLEKTINNLRKIKTSNIINEYHNTIDLLSEVVKSNFTKKFEIVIHMFNPFHNNDYVKEDSNKHITELFNECIKVLEILNKHKKKEYLYEVLIYLFQNDCNNYIKLYDYIVVNNRGKIVYGNKIVERKYTKEFDLLINIYRNHIYSYKF